MKSSAQIARNKPGRAILFINPEKENYKILPEDINNELALSNIKLETFSLKGKPKYNLDAGFDIAISLGGDGTVLHAARIMSPLGVPIFPINLGTFGFIAGIQPLEWRNVLGKWLGGRAAISRRMMLEITVKRGNIEILKGSCLNDVAISATGIARLIGLKVFYNEAIGTGFSKLGSYRSDGLIVSTPTGSTAYSLAAGGPIVDPELEVMILNPICPFTLSHRPMVLPAGETILVEVEKVKRSEVLLTLDGQVTELLKSGDKIYLRKAPYYCLLIASGRGNFYKALRTKLGWAGGGETEGMLSNANRRRNKP